MFIKNIVLSNGTLRARILLIWNWCWMCTKENLPWHNLALWSASLRTYKGKHWKNILLMILFLLKMYDHFVRCILCLLSIYFSKSFFISYLLTNPYIYNPFFLKRCQKYLYIIFLSNTDFFRLFDMFGCTYCSVL